jgi:hypothetical protein
MPGFRVADCIGDEGNSLATTMPARDRDEPAKLDATIIKKESRFVAFAHPTPAENSPELIFRPADTCGAAAF